MRASRTHLQILMKILIDINQRDQQTIFNMKKQSIKKWVKNLMPARKDSQGMANKEQQFQVQRFYEKYPDDSSAEAELINQLIHMNALIRMTRQINYEEYLWLTEINNILSDGTTELANTKKALLGGLNIVDEYSKKRYISSQLPYQYYSVRALLWKINAGYLSKAYIHKWISKMEKHHAQYRNFVKQLILMKIEKKMGLSLNLEKSESQEDKEKQQKQHKDDKQQKAKDHPLNFSGQSKWKSYFNDVQLWSKIQKDVRRTRKQCKFFQEQYFFYEKDQTSLRPSQLTFLEERQQTYADAITRILFIYLKNHPEESYVQGMNEMAALIYYCFTNKNSEYMRRVSQSDSYYVLELVLSKFPRKHFQRGQQYAKKFIEIVKKIDLRLYQEIEENKMIEGFRVITIRWFLTGFLSQFSLDDALLIWDCIISWSTELGIINVFMYIGLAILHLNRNKIIDTKNILIVFSKIQNSPTQIVEKTKSLYKLFPKLFQS